MRSDADEFRFHFVGLGQLVKTVGDGMSGDKNKKRDADYDKGGDFRLIRVAVGDKIRSDHRGNIHQAQDQKNKTRALPDA